MKEVGSESPVRDIDVVARNEKLVRIAQEVAAEYITPAIVRRSSMQEPFITKVALMAGGGLVHRWQIDCENEEEARKFAADLRGWMAKAIEEALERWQQS